MSSGSSGGGKVTVGHYYYAGMRMELCAGPIDAITGIKVDEKTAWAGYCSGGTIYVNAPELFGGETREGGITGYVDIDLGSSSQGRNSYLIDKVAAGVPAYRGVTSAILKHVCIGLNPYMKPWQFRGQRIHTTTDGDTQWYDAKSSIASDDCGSGAGQGGDLALHIAIDCSTSMGEIVTGTTKRIDIVKEAVNTFLDHIDDNILGNNNVDINICRWNSTDQNTPEYGVDSSDITYLKSIVNAITITAGQHTDFREAVDYCSTFFAASGADNAIVLFITDGGPYLNDESMTAEEIADAAATTLFASGVTEAYGFNVWLTTTYYTEKLDNTPSDGVPVIDSSDSNDLANALANAVIGNGEYSYGPGSDMNPAHMIRECHISPDFGMGYDSTDIDATSFEDAADTLYTEGFGLSILWMRQTRIEEFNQDILKHINAVTYVSRTTGKFVIKLIRDDYSLGSLITLDESSVTHVSSAKRPALDELVNSVTVQYWDFCTGQDASLTVQNEALMFMQGTEINTTIQYPMITNFRNAQKAALRDLRALSTPLLSVSLEANRTASTLNIGDVFKLYWPDLSITNVVMRITAMAFGDGLNNRIRIDCVEDVFHYSDDVPLPSTNPEPSWTNPSQPPAPLDYRLVTELPYYGMVLSYGERDANEILDYEADTGFVVGAAPRPTSGINAIMSTDAGSGYVESALLDFCGTCLLTAAVDQTDTAWTFDNSSDIDLVDVGTWAQVDDEIIVISAIDDDAGTMTVGRGVLDTVPAEHADNARIYFWQTYHGQDRTEYVSSDAINVRIQPVTGRGTLPLWSAPIDSITMQGRANRPYPPGKLRIGGVAYPTATVEANSIAVTWAHRDRLQQTSSTLYDESYGDIGPETGTTYTVTIYDSLGVAVITHSGETGTSKTVDLSTLDNGMHTLTVCAVRGAYTSWQCATWEFDYQYSEFHAATYEE